MNISLEKENIDYVIPNILICNYNHEKYLESCIQSALSQDYDKPYMITIVDDASTDNSFDVIKKICGPPINHKIFKRKHQDIIWDIMRCCNIHINFLRYYNNLGLADARNVALENTIDQTSVYFILDADDEMPINKMSELIKVWELDPINIGVVYSDYEAVQDGHPITENFREPFHFPKILLRNMVASGSLIDARHIKKVIENNEYYDSSLTVGEDYDMWIRLAQSGSMIIHHPVTVTRTRITGNNMNDYVLKSIWERDIDKIKKKAVMRMQYG